MTSGVSGVRQPGQAGHLIRLSDLHRQIRVFAANLYLSGGHPDPGAL